ncbi:MAG: hypothetical protein K940chlam9_00676 [Chlamydiae bacterium]|nr:hypothetical protein [Chlamydiota bacterium]
MKRLFLFLLVIALTLTIAAHFRLNDGFSIRHISGTLPGISSKESLPLMGEQFTYLGKGSQMYVFESEDGSMVLKCFRLSRYRLPVYYPNLPLPPFQLAIQKQKFNLKEKKRTALIQSCEIAYQDLQEETGLFYLHLSPTNHLNKTVTLYDKLGRPHPISLDKTPFILQKKGKLPLPYLQTLLQQGKQEEAQKALTSLSNLLLSRMEKGIIDDDAVLHKNAGFSDGEALFLDIGQFRRGETPNPIQEISRLRREITSYLSPYASEAPN